MIEGGGIEVNGRGTLLTTEECYLHPKIQVRNPGMTRKQYNETFRKYLGAKNVFWLRKGPAGDDTHGHIDDICRFVNPKTLVLIREKNKRDVNYRPLAENWERIKDLRLENGSKPEIVPLPMPAPLYFAGRRLPASYANFYICNACVIVPTFNDPNDRVALGILGELFKGRPVVGIHAVDLVLGSGSLHCLTQQQPASLKVRAGCDYALNCFTASTQRPQIVGCSLFEPTSVSQCQQRSHFWPSALNTANLKTSVSAMPSRIFMSTISTEKHSMSSCNAIPSFNTLPSSMFLGAHEMEIQLWLPELSQ